MCYRVYWKTYQNMFIDASKHSRVCQNMFMDVFYLSISGYVKTCLWVYQSIRECCVVVSRQSCFVVLLLLLLYLPGGGRAVRGEVCEGAVDHGFLGGGHGWAGPDVSLLETEVRAAWDRAREGDRGKERQGRGWRRSGERGGRLTGCDRVSLTHYATLPCGGGNLSMPVEGVVTSISVRRRGLGAAEASWGVKTERVSRADPPPVLLWSLLRLLLELLLLVFARFTGLKPYLAAWGRGVG